MAAPKGNKFSTGRPVGSKNEKTEQWERFSEWMMEAGLVRFQTEIQALEGEKFIQVVKDLMEFFKPKLARQEQVGKDGKDLPTPIINVSANFSNRQNPSSQEEN